MPTPIMGTKVSIGPCKHVRWTTPATTGAVSCLDCGLSKSAQQQDLDVLREDVADQIAREGAGSTYSLTAGYVAYLVSLVPAALTQFVRQDGVVGALELRDKKVAECPDANLDPNKDCARCGASSNEGCRITALADAAFVHSVRATLSPTDTGLDPATVERCAKVADAISRKAAAEIRSYDSYGGPSLPGRQRELSRQLAADEIAVEIRSLLASGDRS